MKGTSSEFRWHLPVLHSKNFRHLKFDSERPGGVEYSSKRSAECVKWPFFCSFIRVNPHTAAALASSCCVSVVSQTRPSLRSHYWCSHPASVLLMILLVAIRPVHLITIIFWFKAPTCHYCKHSVSLGHSCRLRCECSSSKLVLIEKSSMRQSGSRKRYDSKCVCGCVSLCVMRSIPT